MENRETGTVKWFNNHFRHGFIKREHGDDIFFNDPDSNLKILYEGQKLEFTIDKSGLMATNIEIAGEPLLGFRKVSY